MSPPLGRHSSSTLTSAKQPGWPNCPSGCNIRMKPSPDWCDDVSRKYSKFDPCRADICDSMYKASSMALLRSRATDACSAAVDKGGDQQQYLEACRKIVEFMCALWREQKMCDVKIKAKDDSIQVSLTVSGFVVVSVNSNQIRIAFDRGHRQRLLFSHMAGSCDVGS